MNDEWIGKRSSALRRASCVSASEFGSAAQRLSDRRRTRMRYPLAFGDFYARRASKSGRGGAQRYGLFGPSVSSLSSVTHAQRRAKRVRTNVEIY